VTGLTNGVMGRIYHRDNNVGAAPSFFHAFPLAEVKYNLKIK
jgi:hypothetical protein